jgi:hypothetical protein
MKNAKFYVDDELIAEYDQEENQTEVEFENEVEQIKSEVYREFSRAQDVVRLKVDIK